MYLRILTFVFYFHSYVFSCIFVRVIVNYIYKLRLTIMGGIDLRTRDLTLVSLFAALTAIGAFVSIPLGPVPLTLQTLFVLVSGYVLGAKKAALAQLVYIALGLVGLPIFAGFSGGVQSVLKPSFGFLVGFVAGAYAVGIMSKKAKGYLSYLAAGAVGTLVIYVFGLPYMAFILNYIMGSGLSLEKILQIGVIAFLPGDLIKLIIAAHLGKRLNISILSSDRDLA